MGSVWLGRDEVLGRQVAIKRIGLLPGADSTDLARAEREARLAARLNHPHVVAVLNFVADAETDARWLVMEYVEGTTLARLVREEGSLSPQDAAALLWQAADALAAAHAAGIVHRDVKPSNILVDRNRRVKLTDFGIARIATDPSLTQTGLVTGSPAYLPPEVAAGQRGDEAVDVWSLGATLFHVLAGRPPYETGDNVLGTLYRIVNDEPPRLAVDGTMASLLEATMAKDPSRRWTMAQVRDSLAGPAGRVGTGPPRGTEADSHDRTSSTRVLDTVGDTVGDTATPAPPASSPAAMSRAFWGLPSSRLFVALAASLVVALVLVAVLRDRGQPADAGGQPSGTPPSHGSGPGRSTAAPRPTARGMESFISGYVAAVGSDPDTAWRMLTPRFQRESGGLSTYRRFWHGVGTGRILDISADPRSLVVSYRVRFDNFGTGRRPTVLDLAFHHGHYLIDGERTEGVAAAR
jgi:eukaryotic-like serine/threonine-protein kinase